MSLFSVIFGFGFTNTPILQYFTFYYKFNKITIVLKLFLSKLMLQRTGTVQFWELSFVNLRLSFLFLIPGFQISIGHVYFSSFDQGFDPALSFSSRTKTECRKRTKVTVI